MIDNDCLPIEYQMTQILYLSLFLLDRFGVSGDVIFDRAALYNILIHIPFVSQSVCDESIIIYHRWRILSICKDFMNTINIVYRLHGNNHSLEQSLNLMHLDNHPLHLIQVSRRASQ